MMTLKQKIRKLSEAKCLYLLILLVVCTEISQHCQAISIQTTPTVVYGSARLVPGIKEEGNYKYQLTVDDNAVITQYVGKESFLATPQILGGYPVTEIGTGAFMQASSTIKRLTISEGIKNLRKEAFIGLSFSSSRVELPSSLECISADAFSGTGVKKLSLPEELKVIEDRAFYGSTALTGIYIPSSVYEIGKSAFASCPDVTIYGTVGSYAQIFAEENKIPFAEGMPTDEAVWTPPDNDFSTVMSRYYRLSPEDHARLHYTASTDPQNSSDNLLWLVIIGWGGLAACVMVSAVYFRKKGMSA